MPEWQAQYNLAHPQASWGIFEILFQLILILQGLYCGTGKYFQALFLVCGCPGRSPQCLVFHGIHLMCRWV